MFNIIILAFLSLTEAAIYKDGPCPAVDSVKNLNLSAADIASAILADVESRGNKFQSDETLVSLIPSIHGSRLEKDGTCDGYIDTKSIVDTSVYADGIWWELAKYPNDFEDKGDCTFLAFKKEDGVIKFQLGEVAEKHFESFDGSVDFSPNAAGSALLDYNSFNFNDKEKTTIMSVYVLTVDYDKYFIGYECRYDEAKKKRHEYAWVKARTKVLDPATKTSVDNFLKSSPLIDADKLVWDKFDADTCKMQS